MFRDYPEADFSSVPDLEEAMTKLNLTIEYLESVYPIGWSQDFYFQSFRSGYTLYTACCQFGGGVNITRNFTEIENQDGVSCIGKCDLSIGTCCNVSFYILSRDAHFCIFHMYKRLSRF